jgi:inner membrane transporter RhtA
MQTISPFPKLDHFHFPIHVSAVVKLFQLSSAGTKRALQWIPPGGLVLLSCFAIQASNIGAKSLFVNLGVVGAGVLCKGMAALFLLCKYPPNLKQHSQRDYTLAFLLGLSIAAMTLLIYGAIARIPLGVASTLEFLGPLSVAVLGSRRKLDFAWISLAGLGVFLLSPIHHTTLDFIGVILALLSGVCWGSYIVLSDRVGRVFPGKSGLALSMAIATLLMMPFGSLQTGGLGVFLQPQVLFVGVLVALLGVVLPYSLEYTAIQKLSPRVFGVLMSIEPAIAALVGFLVLGEVLSFQSVIAIALVTIAAMGSTASRD